MAVLAKARVSRIPDLIFTRSMRKISLENYRGQKDYPGIVAAVAQVLARQRFVAPVDVFLGIGLLGAGDLGRWRRGEIGYLANSHANRMPRTEAIGKDPAPSPIFFIFGLAWRWPGG